MHAHVLRLFDIRLYSSEKEEIFLRYEFVYFGYIICKKKSITLLEVNKYFE